MPVKTLTLEEIEKIEEQHQDETGRYIRGEGGSIQAVISVRRRLPSDTGPLPTVAVSPRQNRRADGRQAASPVRKKAERR